MSQEEVTNAAGQRNDAAVTRISTQAFAKHFTEKLPQLADKSPVFAELQNLVDLMIAAALIRDEGIAEQVGWSLSVFLDPQRATLPPGNVPRTVPSMANVRRASRGMILGLVGGGVDIRTTQIIRKVATPADAEGRLTNSHHQATPPDSEAEHRWWWD
jgi:hypothetical protein